MKKEKLVEKFKELSIAEFDELINHFNSEKEDENSKEDSKENSDNVETKKEETLPDNIVTKEEMETYVTETNAKIEKYETILQELMKDKPVGVQRKVVSKAKNNEDDGEKYYDTSNYLQSLKRKR